VKDGQIIASGSSDEIAQDPMARKYYLGQDFRL
jgi:ABC-type lipopolysaccharide export system ATPase subunit